MFADIYLICRNCKQVYRVLGVITFAAALFTIAREKLDHVNQGTATVWSAIQAFKIIE